MNNGPQAGADFRAMNNMMVTRILETPFLPYKEGGYVLRVVEIKGRKSGNVRKVPLAVTQLNGVLYLISPRVNRDWPLNLLASGECVLVSVSSFEPCTSERIEGAEAIAVLRNYIGQLPWAREQFPFSSGDPDEAYYANMDKVAVFRLSPVLLK